VLTLDGGSGSGTGRTLRYDLNGFEQTLAGLTNVTGLNLRRQQVDNTGAPTTLTVNNVDNYTFGGSVGSTNARIQGAISLTKSGAGTFTLVEVHTYTGDTTVNEGTLRLDDINPSNESSTVTLAASGATLDLDFSGADTVDKLFIGATQMAAGTYKAVGSAASGTALAQLAGSGTLNVTSGPPVSGYSAWATLNGAGANLDGDHDDDGVTNGVEYFIGGPNGNTTGFTAVPGVTDTAGTLSITWTHAADYTGAYGADFEVETSDTLSGIWSVATTSGTPGVANTVYIDGDNVTYTFPAGTKDFARLKVTGP
jgi:autotransporter-associated beta strand protein